MRNKSLQRVLSLILCALLCAGLFPAFAFAEAEVLEEPVAEEPVAEEPVVEEPVVEEPVVEESVVEAPVVEETLAEEPLAEEPIAEESIAEEPLVETDEAAMTAAAEEGEDELEETELAELVSDPPEPESLIVDVDMPDNLLDGYADKELGSLLPQRPVLRAPKNVGGNLSGYSSILYQEHKSVIGQIAAGQRESTVISIPSETLLDGKVIWTAEELGVDPLVVDGAINSTPIFNSLYTKIGIRSVLTALLLDCPYEMYWYDKTIGIKYQFDTGLITVNNQTAVKVKGSFVIRYTVASEYQNGGVYTMNTALGQQVQSAVKTAKGIVSTASSYSLLDKLDHYRQRICDLVSYNSGAAAGSVAYGNPWQLIWVFDDNSDTNVVCEGYAKAFQYLCDLSNIGIATCYTVTGQMAHGTGAGNHMWNIVTMPDGKNYLVDITNCDAGSVGNPDKLFLKGCGGAYPNYNCCGVSYSYDQSTLSTFSENDLTLSATDYSEATPAQLSFSVVPPSEKQTVGAAVSLTARITNDGADSVTLSNYTISIAGNGGTMENNGRHPVKSDGYTFAAGTVLAPGESVDCVLSFRETVLVPTLYGHTISYFVTLADAGGTSLKTEWANVTYSAEGKPSGCLSFTMENSPQTLYINRRYPVTMSITNRYAVEIPVYGVNTWAAIGGTQESYPTLITWQENEHFTVDDYGTLYCPGIPAGETYTLSGTLDPSVLASFVSGNTPCTLTVQATTTAYYDGLALLDRDSADVTLAPFPSLELSCVSGALPNPVNSAGASFVSGQHYEVVYKIRNTGSIDFEGSFCSDISWMNAVPATDHHVILSQGDPISIPAGGSVTKTVDFTVTDTEGVIFWAVHVDDPSGATITDDSCPRSVPIIAGELTVEPSELSVAVKQTAKLTASGMTQDLVWTSSNETVATVDQNGLVTANKYGKAMITATVPGTDLSASCEVQTLFWDVADDSKYYFKHVYWAAEAGITNGYDLEYFGPQLECTREQMMTFLWRMAGKPEPTTTKNPFPDVPSSAYYHKAVLWGVEKGITNGFSSGEYAGKFGVGLPCTREQAMTFLWRMAGKPNPSSSTNPFADIKPSDYYYKAVLWASQNGIANGYTSGEYAGKYGVGLACLREHMVTFLSRYNSKFG